jgi:hypothetical protein
VIVLLPLVGPTAWLLAGRAREPVPVPAARRTPRPSSPDDDPDFLRNLDARRSARDREHFDAWERDLGAGPDDPAPPA